MNKLECVNFCCATLAKPLKTFTNVKINKEKF